MPSPNDRSRPGRRIDWKAAREGIDLARVAVDLLGPAPGRAGEHGRRLWWSCPFHDDPNPSLCIEPGKSSWRCYGCDEHGDAATLVMKVKQCTFSEAIAHLTGGPLAPRKALAPRPVAKPGRPPEPERSGLTSEAAEAVVNEAVARLWSSEGSDALAYLTGPERCLTPATIRAARLGYADRIQARAKDGHPYTVRGIVIPWYEGEQLKLVKVRQPAGSRPKYAELYRDRPGLLGIYPRPEAVRPGRPLIVVEGEFDALCLSQELGKLASVVTLGSASARPEPAILGRMLSAAPWFVATDADAAGTKSAEAWPASARRVPPPGSFKDWTEAKAAGIDLARWWRDVLAGVERPELFTWDELARQRWGPAIGDPTQGIDIPFL